MRLLFLLTAYFSFLNFSYSHYQPNQQLEAQKFKGYEFIENKSQWQSEILFKTNINDGAFFLTENGFVYNFQHADDFERLHHLYENGEQIEGQNIRHHAYRVSFLNSSLSKPAKGLDKLSNYHNYFIGNDPSKWASHVPLYRQIEQKDIYPGISLLLYSEQENLKYDFLVEANMDPSRIQLKFDGVSPRLLANGDLLIETTVNKIIEQKPISYQIIEGKRVEVASKYVLKNNILSFAFPEGYRKDLPLVIDPTLVFATYSGSTSSSGNGAAAYSYATTYDDNGCLYAGADSWTIGWPTTIGAFQTTFGGGSHDVGINKYTSDGSNLVYSTYYGGNGADYPNAMIVNAQDELIIIGNTTSANLPLTTGCYDNTYNGGRDIFIVHFNATGSGLIGATYLGTSASEPNTFNMTALVTTLVGQNLSSPLEINVDANGNIWGVANTTSNAFPVTANAFQNTISGSDDGVVFQFDPTLSNLLYSTYLGGSGNDVLFGIQFNSSGHVIVCGATNSNNFPTTSNVVQSTFQGTLDGFVSIINPQSGQLLHSTYLGTSAADQAVNLQVDDYDNVYVLGRTLGNYPISPNAYNVPDGDIFVDKLNPTLSTSLLSTRMGTPQSGSKRYFPTAFLLDICENIYLAGLGGSNAGSSTTLPTGMPLTPDAISSNYDNFWFGVLYPNFSDLLFGSYYGSPADDHTHVGVNRLDPDGIVYHSICSASAGFPTTAGAYQQNKLNSGQDIISFKFDFDATGVKAQIETPPNIGDSVCAPVTIQFLNNSTSPHSMVFDWDFGDGTQSNSAVPLHTFTDPGIYTIVLHAHSDSACIPDSWDTLVLTVLEVNKPEIVTNDTTICSLNNTVQLSVNIVNPSPYQIVEWGPPAAIVSGGNQNTANVDPSVTDEFYVIVYDSIPGLCGVSTTDTIKVDYIPGYVNMLTPDTAVCEMSTIQLRAEVPDNYTFVWSPVSGMVDPNRLDPTVTITHSQLFSLTASNPDCPDVTGSVYVSMDSLPRIFLPPLETCGTDSIDIIPMVDPDLNNYLVKWTPSNNLRNDGSLINKFSGAPGFYSYNLSVKSPRLGCNTDFPVTITVFEPVRLKLFPSDTIVKAGESFIPRYEGHGLGTENREESWTWWPPHLTNNPFVSNPVITPEKDVQMEVLVINENGCVDSGTIHITVEYESNYFLPNAFSPNNDGLNDVFGIQNLKYEKLNSFRIFNKFGQEIFSTTDPNKGWDGTFKDKPLENGVYYYQIILTMPRGEKKELKGDVTLIR